MTTMFFDIEQVSSETGLAKETLRSWERRYGFPKPERDEANQRLYSVLDIEKLKVIKRLLAHVHRPSKLASVPIEELRRMLRECRPPATNPVALASLEAVLATVRRCDGDLTRRMFEGLIRNVGLERFVLDTVLPLCASVDLLVAAGELEFHKKRQLAAIIQSTLRDTLSTMQYSPDAPKILLVTLLDEDDETRDLAARVLFALDGAACSSLGAGVPWRDIAHAAIDQGADIVAIPVSASCAPRVAKRVVAYLEQHLSTPVEIWIIGGSTHLGRTRSSSVRKIAALSGARSLVQSWRADGKAQQRPRRAPVPHNYSAILHRLSEAATNVWFTMRLDDSRLNQLIVPKLLAMDEVLLCHTLAGNIDLLLGAEVANSAAVAALHTRLAKLPGVESVGTHRVLAAHR